MIYLDTSVFLAQLLVEDRKPPEWLWRETLVSSRLLEYEAWNRLHAMALAKQHEEDAQALMGRISLLELSPPVLVRALDPFPQPVRTLDAFHLASVNFLVERKQPVRLASYDERMTRVAAAMDVELIDLDT